MFTEGQTVVVESKLGWIKVFNLCTVKEVTWTGFIVGNTQFDELGTQRGSDKSHKVFVPNAEYSTGKTAMQALTESAAEISEDTRLAALRFL